jgi:hypothetical protein
MASGKLRGRPGSAQDGAPGGGDRSRRKGLLGLLGFGNKPGNGSLGLSQVAEIPGSRPLSPEVRGDVGRLPRPRPRAALLSGSCGVARRGPCAAVPMGAELWLKGNPRCVPRDRWPTGVLTGRAPAVTSRPLRCRCRAPTRALRQWYACAQPLPHAPPRSCLAHPHVPRHTPASHAARLHAQAAAIQSAMTAVATDNGAYEDGDEGRGSGSGRRGLRVMDSTDSWAVPRISAAQVRLPFAPRRSLLPAGHAQPQARVRSPAPSARGISGAGGAEVLSFAFPSAQVLTEGAGPGQGSTAAARSAGSASYGRTATQVCQPLTTSR